MAVKQFLRLVHLWMGLILCVPLVLLGLTGSILVFEHELEDLFQSTPTYTLTAGTPRSAGEILDAARKAAPEGFAPTMLRFPPESNAPATVRLSPASRPAPGSGIQMLIDPVSLAIFETGPSTGLLRQIQQLHANLLIRDYGGRDIVGWLGVVMLLLGISGVVIWWPRAGRWRAAFGVNRKAQGLRLHRELHGMVGIWGLVAFIIVSFSGVYLAFPKAIHTAIQTVAPARDIRAQIKVTPAEDSTPIDASTAISLASAHASGSKLLAVNIPTKQDQPYRISFAQAGYEDGTPSLTVFVNPWNKEIVEIRDPARYTSGETFMAWQHAIHAGHGFGLVWKILVFICGFLPLLFSITGVSMWLLKRRIKADKK